MAQKYGFFNAVMTDGKADRIYNADDINTFFEGVLSDGVYKAVNNALLVEAGASGLTVKVNTGKALVKQHWYINDAIVTLTINSAHATLNRYTSVVIRYNKANRVIELATVDGANASTPVAPPLTQTEDVYEIVLANIYVKAGATSIASGDITDKRTYVAGLVDPTPLNYRRYDYTVTDYTAGQSYFDIPLSYNLTINTLLQVYVNGLLCQPSEYYLMVNEVEGNYMVVFNEKKALNSDLSFIMIN